VLCGTRPFENQTGARCNPIGHIHKENPEQYFMAGKAKTHEKLDGAVKSNRGEAHASRSSPPQESEEKEELNEESGCKEQPRQIGMFCNQIGKPFHQGRFDRFKGTIVVVGLDLYDLDG
jgi:hypothetical protein